MMDREQLIRERAYVIWDAEGRPAGCDQEHWDRAVREINEQMADQPTGAFITGEAQPARTADAKPAAASSAAETAPPAPARAKRAAKGAAKPAATRSPRGKAGKTPA